MKKVQYIQVELLSDTCFSRGEGTAGVVDVEVEHDELGLPLLGGKTLRGLLRDSWLSMRHCFPELKQAGERVFGVEADLEEKSILRIGDAVVDDVTHRWVESAERRDWHPITPEAVLKALTDIRWQTSEDRSTGASAETALRSLRVVLRGLKLYAPLLWLQELVGEDDLRCLAMSLLATRHAGLGRSRGRGHILLTFEGDLDKTLSVAKGGSA